MNPMNHDHCRCGGPGRPVGENRPLFQLAHLVAALERQEQERKEAERRKEQANAAANRSANS